MWNHNTWKIISWACARARLCHKDTPSCVASISCLPSIAYAARARSLLFYSILPLLSTCLQQIGKAVESNSLLFLCLFPLMTVGSALLALVAILPAFSLPLSLAIAGVAMSLSQFFSTCSWSCLYWCQCFYRYCSQTTATASTPHLQGWSEKSSAAVYEESAWKRVKFSR